MNEQDIIWHWLHVFHDTLPTVEYVPEVYFFVTHYATKYTLTDGTIIYKVNNSYQKVIKEEIKNNTHI